MGITYDKHRFYPFLKLTVSSSTWKSKATKNEFQLFGPRLSGRLCFDIFGERGSATKIQQQHFYMHQIGFIVDCWHPQHHQGACDTPRAFRKFNFRKNSPSKFRWTRPAQANAIWAAAKFGQIVHLFHGPAISSSNSCGRPQGQSSADQP